MVPNALSSGSILLIVVAQRWRRATSHMVVVAPCATSHDDPWSLLLGVLGGEGLGVVVVVVVMGG